MPSALQSRIEDDLKTAMKSGEKRRVATLRLLLSVVKNERIQLQRDPTDEEVEALVRRSVKQRRDSIEQYGKGGRDDLVAAETEELSILETYLPRALSDDEIRTELSRIAADKNFTSSRDVGLLMKELMARHRGKVDGKRAQELARALLP
jgi:uncharacterized protein YqeY